MFDRDRIAIENLFQYFCPDLPVITGGELISVLQMSMVGKNSYSRMNMNVLPAMWRVGHIAARVRDEIADAFCKKVRKLAETPFRLTMSQIHQGYPLVLDDLYLNYFEQAYGISLSEEFDLVDGVSSTCCMYPNCPFFKKKILPTVVPKYFKQYNSADMCYEKIPNTMMLSQGLYEHLRSFAYSHGQIQHELRVGKNKSFSVAIDSFFKGKYIYMICKIL